MARLLTFIFFFLCAYGELQSQNRRLLLEEITGAWCGLCPGGIVFMDSLVSLYPEIIPVNMHIGDPLSTPETETIGDEYTGGGVPGFLIDRYQFDSYPYITFGLDFQELDSLVNVRLATPPMVDVSIESIELLKQTEYNIKIKTIFHESIPDHNYRINLYVIEDHYNNPDVSYNQVNFYNGETNHPFFNLGYSINNFEYKHVLRKATGGAWGHPNSIPTQLIPENEYYYEINTTIESDWSLENIRLVALVQNYDVKDEFNRNILNAYEIKLSDLLDDNDTESIDYTNNYDVRLDTMTGINDQAQITMPYIHPMPATNQSILYNNYLSEILSAQLYTVDGKLLQNSLVPKQDIRNNSIALDKIINISKLPNGYYFLKLVSKNKTSQLKLIKQ